MKTSLSRSTPLLSPMQLMWGDESVAMTGEDVSRKTVDEFKVEKGGQRAESYCECLKTLRDLDRALKTWIPILTSAYNLACLNMLLCRFL